MHITVSNQFTASGDLDRRASHTAPDLPANLLFDLSTGEKVAFSPKDVRVFLAGIPRLIDQLQAATDQNSGARYAVPILHDEHAMFCLREAQRRYGGELIEDDYGMYVIRDTAGLTHTDSVLRAVSNYKRTPKGAAGDTIYYDTTGTPRRV